MAEASKPAPKDAQDLDQLTKDITKLKSDLATLMSDVRDGRLKGAANVGLGRLGDEMSDVYDRVAARGQAGARTVEHYIEENPVPSLLGAAAVGFILGRLLVR
ncbi:MAG: hypothetical protein WEB93_03150 [Sphingomonadales bacterium]